MQTVWRCKGTQRLVVLLKPLKVPLWLEHVLGLLPWVSLKHVKTRMNAGEQIRAAAQAWRKSLEES